MSRILIGVDSTARSEDAIALARRLAHASSAEVVVATVVPPEAAAHAPAHEDAHLTVRRMSGLLQGVQAERIHTGVVPGRSAAQGLHELAATESASLLIVGSTHTGQLGRVHPGSTGERLLNGAPCAVAVAPHGYRTHRDRPLARIGAAYDGSEESRAALAAAAAAARALDATLEVVSVVPADIYGAPALMGGPSYVAVRADIEADVRKDLEASLAALPADVRAEGVVLDGRPWRELADRSADLDLLFVGSRGYGPLHAVLAGGTSGELMRHAQCPAIVLPRGASTSPGDLFDVATATSA